MTAEQWKSGRERVGFTQVKAARALKVSQPYLSQLEAGSRLASDELARKATRLYRLSPTALPLAEPLRASVPKDKPDKLQSKLAYLGYPGFEYVHFQERKNPAEVLLEAVATTDLDTRLTEALPWVLSTYTDLNWEWLRDRAKLNNAQNRLGYLVHLAEELARGLGDYHKVQVLSRWEDELEHARLANEGTLCRESMPEAERTWLRENRPEAAAHWNLLTGLRAEHLPYAAH